MAAAAIFFGMGFLLLAAATLARGAVPGLDRLAGVPWWGRTGGALGALFIWAALWSVGALGTATLVAGLILGQMGRRFWST